MTSCCVYPYSCGGGCCAAWRALAGWIAAASRDTRRHGSHQTSWWLHLCGLAASPDAACMLGRQRHEGQVALHHAGFPILCLVPVAAEKRVGEGGG